MDIEGLSMAMSMSNFANQYSIKLFDKLLESDTQAAASLISAMSEMPPPAGINELGGLLDIRV